MANEGSRGYCRESSELRISSAQLHMGEEPPVTGRRGSGVKNCPGRHISREENETLRKWVNELQIKDGFFQGQALSSVWLSR